MQNIEALGLKRADIVAKLNETMRRWKWAPDRKRGRPKKGWNRGQPRAVDASVIVLMDEAFLRGCTLNEALFVADISAEAFYNWLALNPAYKQRMADLRQNLKVLARSSIVRGVKFDSDLGLKVLERIVPEEFSLKQSITHNVEFTGISLDKPKVVQTIEQGQGDTDVKVERLTDGMNAT